MRTTAHTPESAAAHRLGLRKRPDLEIAPQQFGAQRYWLVKDPVALRYFHLRDEEYSILQMLDGQTNLEEIKRRFEEAFAPLRLTLEQLHGFLGRLHECGLLLGDAAGQGQHLLEQFSRQRRRRWFEMLCNVLAIRFQGIDPEPLLRWLYPKCRWMFSRWFAGLCAALLLAAAVLVVVHFREFQSKLPDLHTFLGLRNIVWLAVVLAAAKVLHELGHGLACKHYGGECHEIGVMLLVFTPCLYCNVSDAWRLPGKWQRIAVSGAGMMVEIVLAAGATFLWWCSAPGLLNTLCLAMMFTCSLSTVVFNGNPLLRYDGYFILADLLEVPNLDRQSHRLVSRALARFFLGVQLPADPAQPGNKRALLAAYGVASSVYRWLVVVAILWFCYHMLRSWGLEPLGQALVLATIIGMAVVPGWRLVMLLSAPSGRREISIRRTIVTCGLLAVAAAFVLFVPLPFRVAAPVVLEPRDAQRVYVLVPGRLLASVPAGQTVVQGQQLARLLNLDLRKEIVELTGQRNQQRLQLENLRLRQADDPSVRPHIPTAEQALAAIEERLRERQHDAENLLIRAPVAGMVLPPPRPSRRGALPGQLATYQGTPLEERNRGSHLEAGTLLCLVGSLTPLEALLVIDQSDMNFVRVGQRVRVQLDAALGDPLPGTITEVAKTDLKVSPRELVQGAEAPLRFDESGVPRSQAVLYQARVVLDRQEPYLLPGNRGHAKILAPPQSLGQRLYRALQGTFHFAL